MHATQISAHIDVNKQIERNSYDQGRKVEWPPFYFMLYFIEKATNQLYTKCCTNGQNQITTHQPKLEWQVYI